MSVYYISTDSGSNEIEADTPNAAVKEFVAGEGVPSWVRGVKTFERWLEKVGGHGSMSNESTGETLFHLPD